MPYAPKTHSRRAPGRTHGHIADRQATRALNTGSKHWRAIRREVLIRDAYTCHDCGRFGNQVDHDDGDSHNNNETNLVTRCIRCHSRKTARKSLSA